MINNEEIKNELEKLEEYGREEGIIPLAIIQTMLPNLNFDQIDEVVDYLSAKGFTVDEGNSDDSAEDIEIDELTDDDLEDDLTDLDGDIKEEALKEEELEIKISDFDNNDNSNFQTDDIVKLYLHEIGQIDLLNSTQEYELSRSVQNGLMAQSKLDQYEKNNKIMDEEERQELLQTVEEGEEAKNILMESNLRLVVNIAKRYMNRGLSLSDLIQEGNFGLLKAVLKFDPTRGFKFSTYATCWIRQSIARAIADKGRNVRIPVHMHECISRLSRTRRRLTQELHREPTKEELANEMGMTVERILQLQRVALDSISFDASVGDEDDSTLIDLIPDENTLNPQEYTEKIMFEEEINDVLQTLTPREEMVIRLRFGIGIERVHTLEEVGEIMNVTRERVRQIQSKATQRLQHHQRLKRIKQHTDYME